MVSGEWMLRVAAACCLCLTLAISANAKDMRTLYDDHELQNWKFVLTGPVERILKEVIEPALVDKERWVVGKMRLAFPLRGSHYDLFEFWAELDTIAVPILSLKFLYDITYSYHWLAYNGYDPTTIFEYVPMLKYQSEARFPGRRYPRPFDALQIPHNNIDAPTDRGGKFGDIFYQQLRSAIYFILTHEVGHIMFGHTTEPPAVSTEAAIKKERFADIHALNVLQRTDILPDGMAEYFMIMSQWAPTISDFPSTAAYERYLKEETTHPVVGERIRWIAAQMFDLYESKKIKAGNDGQLRELILSTFKIGEKIDDPAFQRAEKEAGLKATLSSVGRRCCFKY
jgi:hypothetical protein